MTSERDEIFMRRAIEYAARGIEAGQTPFGACVVLQGREVASAHNSVWRDTDITAHAEIQAIRLACREVGSVQLTGAEIYSTCEPCPMCFAACHWAGIRRIVFGARIADAAAAGFHELPVSNRQLAEAGGSRIELVEGFLRDECVALFERWRARPDRRAY